MNDAKPTESRAARLTRYAADKRMLTFLRVAIKNGFVCYMYSIDPLGITHRLHAQTAMPMCGAPVGNDAPVLFSVTTNCVRCTLMTP